MRFKITRKNKNQANTIAQILIVLGLLLVLNYLTSLFPIRYDLTETKEFSLTEVTKKTLKSLDDVVNIKAFFTKELPPRFQSVKQDSLDILREYQNIAGKNLQIQYLDPKDDPKMEQEAVSLGIPLLQFTDIEKDKFQVSSGYLGLVITYADKKETIPIIDDTKNLEFELTSALRKATRQETFNIAFSSGHEEWDRLNTLKTVSEPLESQYRVRDLDTTSGDLIPDDIKTLIIAAPKKEFTEREKFVLDQFLMKGKSLFFILDGVQVTNQLQTTPSDYGLSDFLEHYGLKLNQDLVLDVSNEIASFQTGFTTFFTPYPFWVKIIRSGFDQNNVIVNKLESLVLPWVSSVETIKEKIGGKNYSELVKSSERSWKQSTNFDLDPQQNFNIGDLDLKPHTLAVLVTGKFTSFYNDKEMPPKTEKDKDQVSPAEEIIKETENARLVLIGDGDFITEGMVSRSESNNIFFQNVVDFLTQEGELIAIRSKGVTDRPLKTNLSEKEKMSYKYLSILGPVTMVLLIGGLRTTFRKKGKTLENVYKI